MLLIRVVGWMVVAIFGFAPERPDLSAQARYLFPQLLRSPIAKEASKAYRQRNASLAARLAEKALDSDEISNEDERKALNYLYALSLNRSGRTKDAIEAFRLCIDGQCPEQVLHHANWYYGKLLIRSRWRISEEQLQEARLRMSHVPPLSRFGLRARDFLVNDLLDSDEFVEALQLAEMTADLYIGTDREASAKLLLARCQHRLGNRIVKIKNKKEARKVLQNAASLYQEIRIIWPYMRSGVHAGRYLSQLRSQGIKPGRPNSQKWIQLAIETVTQRQRQDDLLMLKRIQSLFPRSASDSTWYMMEVLYAELAASFRMFPVAERSARRVLARCKDKHVCARAGFLLANLTARTKVRGAIQAYLSVEKRFSDPTYGPFSLFKGGEIMRRYISRERAREIFQQCVDTYKDSPSAAYCYWGLGWEAFQSKQYEQALTWFDLVPDFDLDQSDDSILSPMDDFQSENTELAEEAPQIVDAMEKQWEFAENEPVVMELPYRFSRQLERRRFRERILYWRARAFHQLKYFGKALAGYRQLLEEHPYDYYSLMAWENLDSLGATLNFGKDQNPNCSNLPLFPEYSEDGVYNPDVVAADIYMRMGLEKDARTTLITVDRKSLGPDDLRIASLMWLALGDYERSHRISTVPWEGGLPGFMQSKNLPDACLAYPRAFGNVVEGPSRYPGVAAGLVFALIRAESGFNRHAKSVAEALGLTQVIRETAYRTARRLKIRQFRFWKLVHPHISVQVGSAYLGKLTKLFGGNLVLALAAYNAGENAVKRWCARMSGLRLDEFIEEIPFTETNRYVKKLLSFYAIYRVLYQEDEVLPLGINLTSVANIISNRSKRNRLAYKSKSIGL